MKYKTALMKLMEVTYGKPIEELLVGTGVEVAQMLGVNQATVSRWKERVALMEEIKRLQDDSKFSR